MKCSVERLIKAMIGVEQAQEHKSFDKKSELATNGRSNVVTISRSYGSLGKQVAKALADRLLLNTCDRNILEQVARQADVDIELVKRLDENVIRTGFEPWKAFISGQSLSAERYQNHLVSVIMNISRTGGVIVGRGANLILGPEKAFRVRIIGSLATCASRVAERKQISMEEARKRVLTINSQRDEYLKKLYAVDIADCSVYDLIINSDRFSVDQMVNLILDGMQQVGYEIPSNT